MRIEKDKKYICIEDVIMIGGEHQGEKAFIVGNVYEPSHEGGQSLIDDFDMVHNMSRDFLEKHFVEYGGLTPSNGTKSGIKDEESKIDYTEINLSLLDIMAKRMMVNKFKYPAGNSKRPIEDGKLEWAIFRHIRKILQPIENDPESKIDHLAAIACNVSMILDQMELKEKNYEKEIEVAKVRK